MEEITVNPNFFEIKNLTSYSNGEYNLKNVNFDLKKGEVHALVGREESGKKIFVQGIAGLLNDIEGEIFLKGKKISNYSTSEIMSQKNLSFIFSESSLMDRFSIAENLLLWDYPGRRWFPFLVDWPRIKQKAAEIIKKLNFKKLDYNVKVSDLSKEERKLVTIIRAFLQSPEIIVMHDPIEELNSETARTIYQMIEEYKKENKSVIYITKLWEEALRIADRISVLVEGEIRGTLSAAQAKENPRKLLNLLNDHNYYNFDRNREEIKTESKEVLDTVCEAANFLASEYELRDVLSLLAEKITEIMKANGCIINLIDEDTEVIIDNLEYKQNERLEAQLKKEIIFQVASRDDIYYSNAHNKGFYSQFAENNDIKTIICAPLLIRSQAIGIIQIFYQDLYIYSEEEQKYLSAFARQATIAIEDTRLMGRSNLLQESHHRIKNNLQSIIGLVSLQQKHIEQGGKSANDVLEDIVSQIKSIAAVHDLLAHEKLGRSIINVKNLIEAIINFAGIDPKMDINLKSDNIFLPYNKASSIALVVNELINNCLKHGFPNNTSGIIDISCLHDHQEEEIILSIKDNGIGIPEDFSLDDMKGLGLSIIRSIVVKEFNGEMEFLNAGGTEVRVTLPKRKLFLEQK